MVTPTETRPLPAWAPRAGYWCEASAHTPGARTIWLNSHPANSPRTALRWLRSRVQDVTDQLDRPYAQPGHHWLTDEAEHERARTTLAHGETYVLTLHDDTTRYVLSARPTGGTR
ncbi:hypothetical protein ACFXKG_00575 [Streptomyces sp. NPDC059255]|uniref:hypothetical protein n=1 Tax=Streptomyces sp. NPDC059255 TaxID=3346793 RepID=UPI0036935BDC